MWSLLYYLNLRRRFRTASISIQGKLNLWLPQSLPFLYVLSLISNWLQLQIKIYFDNFVIIIILTRSNLFWNIYKETLFFFPLSPTYYLYMWRDRIYLPPTLTILILMKNCCWISSRIIVAMRLWLLTCYQHLLMETSRLSIMT